jgi:hypothetical protein
VRGYLVVGRHSTTHCSQQAELGRNWTLAPHKHCPDKQLFMSAARLLVPHQRVLALERCRGDNSPETPVEVANGVRGPPQELRSPFHFPWRNGCHCLGECTGQSGRGS